MTIKQQQGKKTGFSYLLLKSLMKGPPRIIQPALRKAICSDWRSMKHETPDGLDELRMEGLKEAESFRPLTEAEQQHKKRSLTRINNA